MEEQIKIKCEICSGEYKNYNALANHIKNKYHIKKQVYYDTYLKTNINEGICPTCGNPTKFISISYGYSKHCSRKCSGQDNQTKAIRDQTNKEKYGQDYYNIFHQNFVSTFNQKYGVDNPGQVQEFRDKAKSTQLERYGVECNWSSKDPKLNDSQTRLEKYGYDYLFRSPEDVANAVYKKYGVRNVSQLPEVLSKICNTQKSAISEDGELFDSSWEVKVWEFCQLII